MSWRTAALPLTLPNQYFVSDSVLCSYLLVLLGQNVEFLHYKSRSETVKWLASDLCDW